MDNNSDFDNLATDSRDISKSPSYQTNLQSSESSKPMFDLIELSKWPTLPAPWSSADLGETWIWGDFFLFFQKKPKTILEISAEMQGKKRNFTAMLYHYAMSVFYRLDRNPHGPSHRPILIASLEQANMDLLADMFGMDDGQQQTRSSGLGPLMLCLFTSESHLNFGKYTGDTSPQAVRQAFFELLAQELDVSSPPKMIGTMDQAYGHPETGLPPSTKKKSGCAPVILLALVLSGLSIVGIFVL